MATMATPVVETHPAYPGTAAGALLYGRAHHELPPQGQRGRDSNQTLKRKAWRLSGLDVRAMIHAHECMTRSPRRRNDAMAYTVPRCYSYLHRIETHQPTRDERATSQEDEEEEHGERHEALNIGGGQQSKCDGCTRVA